MSDERPILFSAPMVRALLDGRKTQTRRVVKPQPVFSGASGDSFEWHGGKALQRAGYGAPYVHTDSASMIRAMLKVGSPYGAPGDRLWVRETFCGVEHEVSPFNTVCAYRADWDQHNIPPWEASTFLPHRWIPSIHMPRWASRITLEVTGVRVERLQEISEADAKAEGVEPHPPSVIDGRVYRRPFHCLWEEINGADSWAENPWVWVIEFKQVTP